MKSKCWWYNFLNRLSMIDADVNGVFIRPWKVQRKRSLVDRKKWCLPCRLAKCSAPFDVNLKSVHCAGVIEISKGTSLRVWPIIISWLKKIYWRAKEREYKKLSRCADFFFLHHENMLFQRTYSKSKFNTYVYNDIISMLKCVFCLELFSSFIYLLIHNVICL